jgi:hypothetical protein
MRKQTKDIGAKLPPGHPQYDLITRIYAAFRRDKPPNTGMCSCCMEPEIQADFFTPDLKDLPLYYVRDWYNGAYAPPLPHALWAYLLPRVMEVVLCGEEPSGIGIEVTFRGATGDPTLWTQAQWNLLDAFQRAVFRMQPKNYDWSLDALICTFTKGGWSAEALWDQVLDWPDADLVRRLYRDWCGYGYLSIGVTAFWGEDMQMQARYRDPDLASRIEVFAYSCDDSQLAEQAMQVAEAIRRR